MKSKIITSIMLMSLATPSFASLPRLAAKKINDAITPIAKKFKAGKVAIKKSFRVTPKPELTCSIAGCGNGNNDLTKIKITGAGNKKVFKNLKKFLPSNFPIAKQNAYIEKLCKKNNWGKYSKPGRNSNNVIEPGEQMSFIFAHQLGTKGTAEQKSLWQGYIAVATKADGTVDMFSEGASRFWELLLAPSLIEKTKQTKWASLLQEIAVDPNTGKFVDYDEKAMLTYLELQAKKADTDEERDLLLRKVDEIKTAGCFFRKQSV